MAKVVHLVVDDKFIDAAIREFEAVAPGTHEYLLLGHPRPWRYVRSPLVASCSAAEFVERTGRADVAGVVFHGLMPGAHRLLRRIPAGPAVVWLGWGYDYYGLMADEFPDGLVLPATAGVVRGLLERAADQSGGFPASELSIARPYPKPTGDVRAALSRVDLFCPVLDIEHEIATRRQPALRAPYRAWNYLTLEDDLAPATPDAAEPGPNLLVGNSATPTNNHVEAFQRIRQRVNLDGRMLVVPLSYGDPAYAAEIVRIGQAMFGGAFRPLLDFLPPEEYGALLDSCGLIVMNHVRQQALGNVVIGGLRGARLFLNPASPMTRWLHQRGVKVDDLDEITTAPLSPIERRRNRDAIEAFTCRAYRRGLTRQLVGELLARGTATSDPTSGPG